MCTSEFAPTEVTEEGSMSWRTVENSLMIYLQMHS
jgi:hypothetical protein